jgi:16S rRNA pseudouridine516 synthase
MPDRPISDVLFSQGFGTRRECEALVHAGRVCVDGQAVDDPDARFAVEGLRFSVDGEPWPYQARALLVMNKPAGVECSRQPRHHPGVMTLLPAPLRRRGVQPVGRLDADTTGLLLLTDDGPLIHRLTSPRRHVPKVYEAECAQPLTDDQLSRLRDGVLLNDEPAPLRAAAARRVTETRLALTLTEGKYHQVKRMVAAAGNHVVALHRSHFGALALPADLAPGQWRWLAGAHEVLG